MEITAKVVGSETVIANLVARQGKATRVIRQAVTLAGVKVQARAKEQYLSGRALNTRSGRLRRSVNERTTEEPGQITSTVGTNVPYGRYWELGFDRRVGAGARGGPRTLKGLALEKYFAKHPPGVKHFEARHFLQPSLADLKTEIRACLANAVMEVARNGR